MERQTGCCETEGVDDIKGKELQRQELEVRANEENSKLNGDER